MPADVACTFSQQLHPLVGVDTNRAPLLFLYVDDYSGSIVSLNAEDFCAAI